MPMSHRPAHALNGHREALHQAREAITVVRNGATISKHEVAQEHEHVTILTQPKLGTHHAPEVTLTRSPWQYEALMSLVRTHVKVFHDILEKGV